VAKPSVGRIVHYYRNDLGDLGAIGVNVPIAAIITFVQEKGDLHPMQVDSENRYHVTLTGFFIGAQECLGTTPFSETPKPGHWTWPPRV
jgi:hypothetical protein